MTQDEALVILKTGANVFLTGEPGSGKTYTVNRFSEWLREHGIEPSITASTGIAATHIGGYTIHSWSGIGVRSKLTKYDLDHIANNKRVYGRVNNARVLVIDEVSMLSGQTLEMIEAVCREVRRDPRPFWGLQVVFVGDFFQLPPVNKSETDATNRRTQKPLLEGDTRLPFAFVSLLWQKANPLVCYLSDQHRQEDTAFLEFLASVRRGAVEERHKVLLRTRYAKFAQNGVTQLYSHNADVDHINNAELAKLSGTPQVFVMEGHGPDPLVLSLRRGRLSPEILSLKVGARVMFAKNDPERRLFSQGELLKMHDNFIRAMGGRKVQKPESSRREVQGLKVKKYLVKEMRKEHTNAYQPWTREDDQHLLMEYENKCPLKELAEHFGRKRGAIVSRLAKLTEERKTDTPLQT